jgi:hypothetical protein
LHKAILPCPSWLDPSFLKTHPDADLAGFNVLLPRPNL